MLFKRFYPLMSPEGEGGSTGGQDTQGEQGISQNNPNNEGSQASSGSSEPSQKTFTQEDLNRIAAQEKRQGASSILKALGFENEAAAKDFVKKYRQQEEDKKDDLTKAQEKLSAEVASRELAEKKADLLEKRFKVMAQGVSADKAEDIVILANAKVTEEKDFDTALEELKTAYPSIFSETSSSSGTGTGTSGNPPRGGRPESSSGLGKKLAEQRKSTMTQKNPYFSN